MTISDSKALGCLYVAIASVIWGSNGVIVNWLPLNPYVIALFRVLFASFTLLPLVLLAHSREIVKAARAWRSMLALGLLQSLEWGFLFQSMRLIAIANAVLLNYMAPIFVALLAPTLLKERIERVTIFALVLSMVGMAIISSQQGLQVGSLNFLGVIFGLLAGLAYAGYIILSKRAVTNLSSRTVAFYAYTASIIFLCPSLISADLSMDLTSWILLLLLGVFNTGFAVTLYLNGLRFIEAHRAVIFTYLEPVSAVVFGSLFLAQQPTLLTLIGGLLILSSGYTVASK